MPAADFDMYLDLLDAVANAVGAEHTLNTKGSGAFWNLFGSMQEIQCVGARARARAIVRACVYMDMGILAQCIGEVRAVLHVLSLRRARVWTYAAGLTRTRTRTRTRTCVCAAPLHTHIPPTHTHIPPTHTHMPTHEVTSYVPTKVRPPSAQHCFFGHVDARALAQATSLPSTPSSDGSVWIRPCRDVRAVA